jgi:hypothetical protein
VSTYLAEEYVANENAPKPLKGLNPDYTRTPLKKDGTQTNADFYRYSRDGIMKPSTTSKKLFIQPLKSEEK